MTSSQASAARFLAMRSRKARPYRRRAQFARSTSTTPRRIVVDFAEPTLRAIYRALCERLADGDLVGEALCLTVIATDMVATALGDPTGDDPPLTDREAR